MYIFKIEKVIYNGEELNQWESFLFKLIVKILNKFNYKELYNMVDREVVIQRNKLYNNNVFDNDNYPTIFTVLENWGISFD